ncbi:hypothetical protein AB0K80_31355 [Streptomyces sp. NPDC052682]|uniref:hypothetical protein n=1 Tax=Streptomyces sp. NPDC052682 TaxID=3154954 RepID=UPI00342910CB
MCEYEHISTYRTCSASHLCTARGLRIDTVAEILDRDFDLAADLLVAGVEAMAERGCFRRQLLKQRYFQLPYVVEFTESPDEPLT